MFVKARSCTQEKKNFVKTATAAAGLLMVTPGGCWCVENFLGDGWHWCCCITAGSWEKKLPDHLWLIHEVIY